MYRASLKELHEAVQEAESNEDWPLADYWNAVLLDRLAALAVILKDAGAGDSGTASGADS